MKSTRVPCQLVSPFHLAFRVSSYQSPPSQGCRVDNPCGTHNTVTARVRSPPRFVPNVGGRFSILELGPSELQVNYRLVISYDRSTLGPGLDGLLFQTNRALCYTTKATAIMIKHSLIANNPRPLNTDGMPTGIRVGAAIVSVPNHCKISSA